MMSGKIALVTGGSGSIGAEICRAFTRHGASVAFTWHSREDRARELAAELEGQGRRCVHGRVEATDRLAIEAFVTRTEKELGPIDVLVNNLGAIQVMPFALIEEDDWDRLIGINLKSMFLFAKAAARGMIRRRSGAIVNIGSIAGSRVVEAPVHYATAKAGVTGFTVSLAKELSPYGIRVNALALGLLEGGIGNSASEGLLREHRQFCTLGRTGSPTEVAEVVAFLASSRGGYINAQTVVVDGGL